MSTLRILLLGYTIDKRFPCIEPCPKCGHVSVFHVKEDNNKCFCTHYFCEFEDDTFDSKYDSIPLVPILK